MELKERSYYIDWLRVVVVALLIPHHAAITFSHLGDAYVYRSIPTQSVYYFLQSTFLNLWFMRVLFCISGISTYYALRKRTFREYLGERFRRLLIPTVFAIVFVCPITGYLKAVNSHLFIGSFMIFYPEFFRGFVARYLGWGHFWFLVYLFVFSSILLFLISAFPFLASSFERASCFLSKKKNIVYPIVIFVFLEVLFRPFYPGYQNLYADWANFTVYLSFFLLGYVLSFREQALSASSKYWPMFLGLSCMSTLLFMAGKYSHDRLPGSILYFQEHPYGYAVLMALLQGLSEYSWVIFFIGVGRKYANKPHRVLSYLSKTSFALYIFHFVILSTVLYYLVETTLHHFVIFALAIGITYVVFFIVFELIIKRVSVLRYVCGVKTPSTQGL